MSTTTRFTCDAHDQPEDRPAVELRSTSKCGKLRLNRKPVKTSPAVTTKEALSIAVTLNKNPPDAEPRVTPRLEAAVCLPSSHPCALPALASGSSQD
jgi:hypothetical protein